MLDLEDLHQVFSFLMQQLTKFLPPMIAAERALNLSLVIGGIRPACLWYIDLEFEESTKVLESLPEAPKKSIETGFVVCNGKIPSPKTGEILDVPHTFIFRMDNKTALKLIKNPKFFDDIFANHKAMGQALGYPCAGDSQESRYHVRLAARPRGTEHEFTILEQMCQDRHRPQFKRLAQEIQDFVDQYHLGLEIHLFTTDLES